MISSGVYKHYKGGVYKVLGTAKHTETLEEMVVYQALYGDNAMWIRPLKMFLEEVMYEGIKVPRFTILKTYQYNE